jgi:hypothetical protein
LVLLCPLPGRLRAPRGSSCRRTRHHQSRPSPPSPPPSFLSCSKPEQALSLSLSLSLSLFLFLFPSLFLFQRMDDDDGAWSYTDARARILLSHQDRWIIPGIKRRGGGGGEKGGVAWMAGCRGSRFGWSPKFSARCMYIPRGSRNNVLQLYVQLHISLMRRSVIFNTYVAE